MSWKIELDNKDFLSIIESISKIFLELPLEIDAEGFKVRNISSNKEVAITIDADKEDMKEFECTNKNPTYMTIPFGEFLDATKKIKTPVTIGEEGKAKIYIKGDKISYVIDKQTDDPHLYTNHDAITKLHTKANATEIVIGSGDFITAVDLLSFSSSGVRMKVKDKKLTFESLKGSLAAEYVMDVEVDKKFEWESAYSSEYMRMLKNIVYYSKEIKFFVKNPEAEDDAIPPAIVEIAVASNSDVVFIMAGQKDDDTVPGIAQADEEEDGNGKEDDFEFETETEDEFYNESKEE